PRQSPGPHRPSLAHSADQARSHRPRRRVPRRAPGPGEPPPRPHTAAGQVPAAKPLQADARAGARDPCPLGGRRRHPGAARRGIRRPPQAHAAHRPRARLEGGGMTARFIVGDVFDGLATLEDGSVDLVVTSPPFLALRSYLPADHPDKAKEIGQEANPAAFIDTLLAVTAELRRVLAPHGSICVELGDTYAGSGGAGGDYGPGGWREGQETWSQHRPGAMPETKRTRNTPEGWPLAKSKTLIPELYRVALAYGINPITGQESPAGRWRVRNVVTWCRPNPPVGALGDKWRPATSDIVVACTYDKRYWDDIATRRPPTRPDERWAGQVPHDLATGRDGGTGIQNGHGAPLFDYWEIPPGGYPGSHYAVYPPALIEPLIKAMAPPKVCRTCGEPSRRIVGEPTYVRNDSDRVP